MGNYLSPRKIQTREYFEDGSHIFSISSNSYNKLGQTREYYFESGNGYLSKTYRTEFLADKSYSSMTVAEKYMYDNGILNRPLGILSFEGYSTTDAEKYNYTKKKQQRD